MGTYTIPDPFNDPSAHITETDAWPCPSIRVVAVGKTIPHHFPEHAYTYEIAVPMSKKGPETSPFSHTRSIVSALISVRSRARQL